ncbi:translocation/assembly module TamB domain-containing protein [Nodosilinea nodulosa]|uniref:translocation/assembly module TamB domain-containing protein n=1 Tax=Nodosilinea nodulosa TaxID=416001 RepID=UPI0002DAD0A1|nr:translocation/assembly module TamB domain-containing protein [Nodosilinea nodulosa]
MTNPNHRPPDPDRENAPRAAIPLALKVGAGVGGVMLAGGVAAAIWGRALVNQQVIPRIEVALEDTLERPVDVGDLERFTFNGFRIGPSSLPPTAAVQTEATVEAIDVTISWPDLVFHRTLRPSLTLINPDVAVVQAADGQWIDLTLPKQEKKEPGFITFKLGEVKVENASVSVVSQVARPNAIAVADPVLLDGVNGRLYLSALDDPEVEEWSFEVAGNLGEGQFNAAGRGRLDQRSLNVRVQTTDVPTIGANLLLPPELGLGLKGGTLDSNLVAEVRLQNEDQPVSARGTARLRNGEVVVSQLPEPIRDLNATLRFQGDRVLIEDTGLRVGDIALTAAGSVDQHSGYDLTAQIPAVSVAQLTDLLKVDLPVQAAGVFQFDGAVSGPLDAPQLRGRIENVGAVQADRVAVDALSASFVATPKQITLQALRIVPAEGGFITGQGQVDLANLKNPSFDLDVQADLPGDALAALYGVTLPNQAVIGPVQVTGRGQGTLADPQALVTFQLPESTYPGRGRAAYRNSTLVVDQTQFQVEQGTVNATALARFDRGTWSADITTADVPIERFTDQARGLLNATVTASGSLRNLDLAAIQASGTATLADAEVAIAPNSPSLLERGDWTTAFRWAGNGVQVERFNAPGVRASGFIATDLGATPPIDTVDLKVQLSAYDLRRLAPFIPETARSNVTLAGLASFDGQLTGPLANLRLRGDTQLDNLAINDFAFEPRLVGPLNLALAEGGQVDLRGGGDRLSATLDSDLLPSQFLLRRGETIAEGQVVNRQLTATVQNVPIDALNLSPAAAAGFGPLGGSLDATLRANLTDLANPTVEGTTTIANLALGDIVADSFTGQYRYANGLAVLTDGDLRFANSQYRLSGQADLGAPELTYSGQLDIVAGSFEDLLATLNWSDFSDIGFGPPETATSSAADVTTAPVSLPDASFLAQVQAFAEFMASYEPKDDGTAIALPPLDQLRGTFTGAIAIQGTGFSADTLQATADIQGQNWSWGTLLPCESASAGAGSTPLEGNPVSSNACNQFQLAARYQEGAFEVSPLEFRSPDTQISFVGSGSLDNLSGKLTASGIPVELASLFVDLPADVEGDISTTAQLGGSLGNPQITGKVAVLNPAINQQALSGVNVDFTYDNAVLSFDGAAVVSDPSQIALRGKVPYALPFMTVQPPSDQIDVLVSLKDESLQVLNLVTDDQLRWDGGQGDVTVRVGGTLAEPIVAGRAQFRDGQLSSSLIAQTVTDLTGDVLFNLDQVQVNQLQASFGGGTIVANGRLPIQAAALASAKQEAQPQTGLTIALNQVKLDYSNLIAAQLDGQVLVGGAALNPEVSGDLKVSQGRITPNSLLGQTGALPTGNAAANSSAQPLPAYITNFQAQQGGFNPPQPQPESLPTQLMGRVSLNNLNLLLADQLLIAGAPFYYLTASGQIRVDGTLADLQPDGVITLNSGWINVFSTQFRLIAGETNTATFSPERGLDPFLNVRMRARLQDRQITQAVATPFVSAEVANNPQGLTTGEVQFVSVFATAFGYASELQNASSPGQASELITLTSRPPRSQEDLVTLLTGSVVTNLYGASISQLAGFLGGGTLAGFGDRIADTVGLRSFSVFPTTDTAADSAVGIGIGVEAAFDIGNKIGVDTLSIINSGNPPELGVSYRFNDQLRVRGATNFSGTETVNFEYEVRF